MSALSRSKTRTSLGMSILSAGMISLAGCNNPPPVVKESSPAPQKVTSQFHNKYCYFFEAALYRYYQLLVCRDTIFLYHNNVVEKNWFNKDYKKVGRLYYDVKTPLNQEKAVGTQLFVDLNKGIPKMKYIVISMDIKEKINKLGLHIDEKKALKSGDLYFFLSKADTAYFPSIWVFNAKSEKIDTIQWKGNVTEEDIMDFALFDFKNDGFIDLFVFSKDSIHEGSFTVSAITTSPDWICRDANEPK